MALLARLPGVGLYYTCPVLYAPPPLDASPPAARRNCGGSTKSTLYTALATQATSRRANDNIYLLATHAMWQQRPGEVATQADHETLWQQRAGSCNTHMQAGTNEMPGGIRCVARSFISVRVKTALLVFDHDVEDDDQIICV